MTARLARLRYLQSLDPQRDHYEIYRSSVGYEFPWDYLRALELALFRTYCVPSISTLLSATGEFRDRPQKRYDDTGTLMAEILEHGYDSERGRAALRIVNRLHGRYPISNDDMLYVLSTFVFEPVRWIDRFGWRPLSTVEREAAFAYYREVGRRMGIRDLPESCTELADFKRRYERDRFRYAGTNAEIGRYTVDLFCSWYPPAVRPFVRRAVLCLLDEPVHDAFGFAAQPRWLAGLVTGAVRLRGRVVRLLPPRRRARFTDYQRNRTYPGYPRGHQLSDLGA